MTNTGLRYAARCFILEVSKESPGRNSPGDHITY